jgi:iron complex transport system ATP-binding protein
VIIAAALAQSPRVLLLDEPTAYLDIEHQISIYRLLRDLCETGVLVIAVTHDLNLAAQYGRRVLLLRAGEVAADGIGGEVLTEATIRTVFHVDAQVVTEGGRHWIRYAP